VSRSAMTPSPRASRTSNTDATSTIRRWDPRD
jgi:hypothetical protein